MGLLDNFFRKEPPSKKSGYGVRTKHGTDYVKVPIKCPKCSRVVARRTPERALARCECGYEFAIMNYRPVPLPEGVELE